MKALENYLTFLTLLLLIGSFHANGEPLVPVIWRNGTDEVKFVAGFSCPTNWSSVGSQMVALNFSGAVSLLSYCNGAMCGSMYGFTATVVVNQSVGGEWGILLTRSNDGLTLNGTISCGNILLKPEINDVIYENDHTITWTTVTANADNGWDDVTEGSNSFKRWTAVISCNARTSRTTITSTSTTASTTMPPRAATTTTSTTTIPSQTTQMEAVVTGKLDINATASPAPITESKLTILSNSGVSDLKIIIPASVAAGVTLIIIAVIVAVVYRRKRQNVPQQLQTVTYENVNSADGSAKFPAASIGPLDPDSSSYENLGARVENSNESAQAYEQLHGYDDLSHVYTTPTATSPYCNLPPQQN